MTMEQTSISFDKACIFGAGAIGGWMGAALAGAGCQLSAVARGAALQALRTQGLTLVHGEQREHFALRAEQDPAALGVQDLQSRLNLRNLLSAPDKPETLRPLSRLLERLNLPPAYATQIVQALRAAATPGEGAQFLMPRTLRQFGWLGLPPEVVARLEPFITLLPEKDRKSVV